MSETRTVPTEVDLAKEEIDKRIRELVGKRMSLAQIRSALGARLSRQAIHARVRAMRLVLSNRPFGATLPRDVPFGCHAKPAQTAQYRRPSRPRRQAWLNALRPQLLELLSSTEMTYAQVWDELFRRYPFVPQLAAVKTSRGKSVRIAVWFARERKRAARRESSR